MNSKNLLAGILLCLVSLGHLLRIIFSVDLFIGTTLVPMYASIVACLLFGYAGYSICYNKS